jgi:hypothetical protein
MYACRFFISFLILILVNTCIDPYSPNLSGYESILVVDGLITNSSSSSVVKLSTTMQNQNDLAPAVSDANVYITDDEGNSTTLINSGNGIFRTDSTVFRGVAGRTYVLHILLNNGSEYESAPCMMYPVPDIENVYYERDQQLINNGTKNLDGISIYLDSKSGENQYFRWAFEETWKFRVPFPKRYNYFKVPDLPDNPIILPVADVKEFCWKSRKSQEILIGSVAPGTSGRIEKKPVFFIAPDQTDRLTIQYSILVSQYSISKTEYDFWNNLKQINETGSDIFARQPYSVSSNLHNTKDKGERVLGFFQVSAVSQMRKNITRADVENMVLPLYSSPCISYQLDPHFFDTQCMCPPRTWDDVYDRMVILMHYALSEPIYDANNYIVLSKLVFTTEDCANCELTGTSKEPAFWKEINWIEK